MGVSTLFIRRPIATTLLMLGVLLLGIVGYRGLPVSALPEISTPSVVVTTQYPGANAQTIAEIVTTPLERQLGQISGLDVLSSDSTSGLSTITLQFDAQKNMDVAAEDVQAALNQAALPSGLPYRPTYNRVNPADSPILTLKLTSTVLPLREVNTYADAILAQRLAQVSGVGLVTIAGNVRPAVRIQVNLAQLSNMGLTLENVRDALSQANVNAPKGTLNSAVQTYTIGTNDQLSNAKQYNETIISYKNGQPVFLSDVAKVIDGVENDQLSAFADGQSAVLLEIRRQPGANIVETVAQIRALLPQLRAILPASLHLDVFSDRTQTIRASVADIQWTLLLTIALVIGVIFVFLRRLWATLIPSVAIPLSLAGTFAVMEFANMSMDNLSLMALVVATGFVVDDAIVMIENIVSYIEKGYSGRKAAEIGAQRISFTVVSLTLSLIAVFLPLILMPGIIGRLFNEFAWVLVIAVAVSLCVSLTLTPMMCAYLLKFAAHLPASEENAPHSGVWGRIVAFYTRTLEWSLRYRKLTLAIAIACMLITILMYYWIPKGLLPEQDTGLITGIVVADTDTTFGQMQQQTEQIARRIAKDPAVSGTAAFIGIGTVNPSLNQASISIVLKDRNQRDRVQTVMQRLQGVVHDIPGALLYLKPVQDVTLDVQASASEYQYALSSLDSTQLQISAQAMLAAMRASPVLANVSSTSNANGRALVVDVDRPKSSALGVPIQTIDDTLFDAYGQRQISTIFTDLNQYRVVLEVAPSYRTPQALLNFLTVKSNGSGALTGSNATTLGQASSANASVTSSEEAQDNQATTSAEKAIPLSAFARLRDDTTPLVVSHQQQLPAVVISFDVAPGYALSQAADVIKTLEKQQHLPASVQAQFIGKAAEFTSSQSGGVYLLLAAVVVIYIILGVLYESYIHPLTILSTLPPASLGALLALYFCRMELSIDAIVGIVLLIGIVKKNAIMIIDYAIVAQRKGADTVDAIKHACLVRFRPIIMTTIAALFGALPLAFSQGIGSELRRPLGVTIVGGLILSQLLTLYTTPVIYLFFEHVRTGVLRMRKAPRSQSSAVEKTGHL